MQLLKIGEGIHDGLARPPIVVAAPLPVAVGLELLARDKHFGKLMDPLRGSCKPLRIVIVKDHQRHPGSPLDTQLRKGRLGYAKLAPESAGIAQPHLDLLSGPGIDGNPVRLECRTITTKKRLGFAAVSGLGIDCSPFPWPGRNPVLPGPCPDRPKETTIQPRPSKIMEQARDLVLSNSLD